MTVTMLLEQVRLLGAEVYAVGDRLYLEPASRLSPELIGTLRSRKPEILAALRSEQQTAADRVGPWQPPGTLTRHCPSCAGGLQPDQADQDLCSTCVSILEHLVPARVQ